jgi:hypothetical protein
MSLCSVYLVSSGSVAFTRYLHFVKFISFSCFEGWILRELVPVVNIIIFDVHVFHEILIHHMSYEMSHF